MAGEGAGVGSQSSGLTVETVMMKYWVDVFVRAFQDTRKAIGHNWVKTIVGGLVIAIGAALFGLIAGGLEAWKKLEWWLCTAGAAVLVFVAVYIWKLLNTPKLLRDEQVANAGSLATNWRQQIDQSNGEISELRTQLQEKELTFEKEKQALRVEIEKARNCDPKRNMIRRELHVYIARFRAFVEEVSKGQRKSPLDLSRIELDANNYLKQHFPEYTHFADGFPIVQNSTSGAVLQPHEALPQCAARIARLEEVIGLLG
jgi:hypothetical protein